jgi:translocation and assembly module TamB
VLRGTLAPLKTNPKLDFQGNFAKIDLMGTQDLLDEAKIYLKGIAGGTLVITGTPESPQITLEITSPKILVNSLPLEDVSGTLGISPQEIRMDPLVVHAGSSPVTISTVVLPEKSWESSFSATSDSLDLASLLQSWELASPETPFFPRGKLRLRVQGNVRNGRLLGQGNISSPELSAGTLRGEKIHLPFVFDENTFTLQESSLSFYQGILRGEGTINYAEKPALWKAHLWGEDIQISPFLRDLHPLSGDISGTGAFDLTLKGPLNYLFMTNGEGHITVREGAFSEFPQLAPLLAKAPQPQLDFASLQVYFSVDGRTLYFVPGSRLTAPPGNPIYRYFAADGFLPFTGRPMNINCITEINAPAINAFLGAFAGFLETVFLTKDISQLGSLTNLTQAVEDALLGGIFGGLAKSDFREISFSLKGTMEKPEMANLSIAPKQGAFLLNPQDKDKGEKGRDFQLSFSFPTGEGKKTSDDISGQFKDQIFEQAIKQLIPLGD